MAKVIVVTGAGGWLGSAIARAFGEAGDKVLVNDINPATLPAVTSAINKGPGQAVPYVANTRNYEEVKAMVDEAVNLWGKLDVMACVAGGNLTRLNGTTKENEKLLTEYSDEDWDLVVDTNLKGIFHSIKAASGPMMAQQDGQIIIMGSWAGFKGGIRRTAYSAAKAGVVGLMKTAALELGDYNIRLNVVAPGKNPHPGEVSKPLEGNILKRTNTPGEVAAFFVHLSRMKNVSGQIINLDSGILF